MQRIYRFPEHASDYGITVQKAEPDVKAIVKRSRDVAAGMSKGIQFLFKKNKIDHIAGIGKLKKGGKVEVTDAAGKKVDYFPYDIDGLAIKPIYKELKGWKTDLTKMRKMEEAPKEFLDYITYLEGELNVPVTIVSVGPDREQTIIRQKS